MKQSLRKLEGAKGFTLIEILVVIGLIAVLAAIVIIAINPARQFALGRNSQRTSNTTTILNAIGQRIADGKGVFAGTFTTNGTNYTCPTLTAGTTYNISSAAGDIDLSCLTPTYIPTAIPFDPSAAGAHWTSAADYDTKYLVTVDAGGRYTVCAPTPEASVGNPQICITR